LSEAMDELIDHYVKDDKEKDRETPYRQSFDREASRLYSGIRMGRRELPQYVLWKVQRERQLPAGAYLLKLMEKLEKEN